MKIILILCIMVIIFTPVLFHDSGAEQKQGSSRQQGQKQQGQGKKQQGKKLRLSPRRKMLSYSWKGPKTDPRINTMLAESIGLLKELGVPISNSICPDVRLTGSHRAYGRCCPKGSLKRYTEYDFYIELSGHTLENTEKSIRNTLIHELLHTVPGGLRHTGEWKKWAKFVSAKTGYDIKRLDGDKTEEDRAKLIK
jgi:hypothetical protein